MPSRVTRESSPHRKNARSSPFTNGASKILLDATRIKEALGDDLQTERTGGEMQSPCARPQLAFSNPLAASIGINVLNTPAHADSSSSARVQSSLKKSSCGAQTPLVTFEGQNEYHYWLRQTIKLASGGVANTSTREQRRLRDKKLREAALAATSGAGSSLSGPSQDKTLTKRERARAARRRKFKKRQPLIQPPIVYSTRKISRFEIQAKEARDAQAWYRKHGLENTYAARSGFQPREDHPEMHVGKEFRTVFHLPDNIDYQLEVARAQEGFLAGEPILHIPRSFSPARWIPSVEGKPDFDLVPRHSNSKGANQELRKATLRDLAGFWFDDVKPPSQTSAQAPSLSTAAAAMRSHERKKSNAVISPSLGHGVQRKETEELAKGEWKFGIKKTAVSELQIQIPVTNL